MSLLESGEFHTKGNMRSEMLNFYFPENRSRTGTQMR